MSNELPLPVELWLTLFAIGGALAGVFLLRLITAVTSRTRAKWDNELVWIARDPAWLLGAAAGIYIGMTYGVEETPRLLNLMKLITTLALVWGALRAVNIGIKRLLASRPILQPVEGLIRATVNIVVLVLGLLMVLDAMGVSIGPLLASLGVGSLAVALALKDTLANLFGGVYLAAGQPMRPGDYIRTEHGEEGTVVAVSWRSTEIRTANNALVIIPNANLAQGIMVNYTRPVPYIGSSVQVEVAYDHDPRLITKILTEIANQAIRGEKTVLADPPPNARLIPGFVPSGMQFTLSFTVESIADQAAMQDEIRMRIWERFKKEGISFASSQKMFYLGQPKQAEPEQPDSGKTKDS